MLNSKSFLILWSIWTLVLGISLAFVSLIPEISSFDQYLNAFIALDMPNSWCPTFLTLYGLTTLLSLTSSKLFTLLSKLTGLILLPIGLYAAYEFTFQNTGDPLPIYIYAQTIHLTEILTGLFTFKRKST